MAPKKAGKSAKTTKAVQKLGEPVVTEEALKQAQQILADEAELKRQRSNLAYQLQVAGKKPLHAQLDTAEKHKISRSGSQSR